MSQGQGVSWDGKGFSNGLGFMSMKVFIDREYKNVCVVRNDSMMLMICNNKRTTDGLFGLVELSERSFKDICYPRLTLLYSLLIKFGCLLPVKLYTCCLLKHKH